MNFIGLCTLGSGDVIGCLIHLGDGGRPLEKKAKEIVRWRGILHYVDEPDPDPNVLPGSSISFLKNGVFQGIAYRLESKFGLPRMRDKSSCSTLYMSLKTCHLKIERIGHVKVAHYHENVWRLPTKVMWICLVIFLKEHTILLARSTHILMKKMVQLYFSILVSPIATRSASTFIQQIHCLFRIDVNYMCAGPNFQYSPPALEDSGESARPFCELAGDPPKDEPIPSADNTVDQTLSSQPVKQEEPPLKP